MKRINKVFNIIFTILQIALVMGIYMVNHFTSKRMGMLRYVLYKNKAFEQICNIEKLQYISIIVLVLLMILNLGIYIKRRSKLNKNLSIVNIFMVILVVIFVGFNLLYSTDDFKAFYFMSLMLGVTTIIQVIKTFISNTI